MTAFNTTNADTADIPPIFKCPADKNKQNIAMRISYGTNMNLAGWGSHATWGRYGEYGKKYYDNGGMQHETVLFRPSTVPNPSKVVYGADVKQGNPFFAKPNWKSHIEGFSGEKFPRHNNRSNVWFIDGETLFEGAFYHSCTSDGCHPNDLGFFRMAEKIGPVIMRSLGFM